MFDESIEAMEVDQTETKITEKIQSKKRCRGAKDEEKNPKAKGSLKKRDQKLEDKKSKAHHLMKSKKLNERKVELKNIT